MRRRPVRSLVVLAATALVAAAVPLLAGGAAQADLTHGNPWVLKQPGLSLGGPSYRGDADAVGADAGAAGTVVAQVQKPATGSTFLRIGMVPPSPNSAIAWVNAPVAPFSGVTDLKVAADPATGDAAVLYVLGVVDVEDYVVRAMTYSAASKTWSQAQGLFGSISSYTWLTAGSTAVTVTGHSVHVALATESMEDNNPQGHYGAALRAFTWPADGTPSVPVPVVLASTTGQLPYASGQSPMSYVVVGGVDPDGVTQFAWVERSGYAGANYVTDPSTLLWSVSVSHEITASPGTWSAPATLLGPVAAKGVRTRLLARPGRLLLIAQPNQLTSAGTGPTYADATYATTTTTITFNAGGTTTSATPAIAQSLADAPGGRFAPLTTQQVGSGSGAVLTMDPTAPGGLRSVDLPDSIDKSNLLGSGLDNDGDLWVAGPCAAEASHVCVAARSDLTASGTWTPKDQLPDALVLGPVGVVPSAFAAGGVFLLVPQSFVDGGTDVVRAFRDVYAPDFDTFSVQPADGSLALYPNGDVQDGGTVDLGSIVWDNLAGTMLDFRFSVDGVVVLGWTPGTPVDANQPNLEHAAGSAPWTASGVGSHSWTVDVRDQAGNVASSTRYFDVALPFDTTAPTVAYSTNGPPVVTGRTFTLTRTAGSDDRSAAADVAVVVDWGDGQTSNGTLATSSFQHTYATAGARSWSVTATDEASNATTDGPHAINVLLPPPPAPTALVAKPGYRSVALTWSPKSNVALYSAITGLTVMVTEPNTPEEIGAATPYNFPASAKGGTITGLTNGVTYSFNVFAWTAAGPSVHSAPVHATPIGRPARPTALRATTTSSTTTRLAWTAPRSTAANPVSGYRIYVNGVLVKTLTSRTAVSWTHSGEKKGRTYTYAVFGYNAVWRSSSAAALTKRH